MLYDSRAFAPLVLISMLLLAGCGGEKAPDFNLQDLSLFKDRNRINYAVVRGNEMVARDYGGANGMALPTMFVITGKGKIADKHVGFVPGRVEKSLKKLIG